MATQSRRGGSAEGSNPNPPARPRWGRTCAAVLVLAMLAPAAGHAGKIPLVDAVGATLGSVSVNLWKGVIKVKIGSLSPLPALVNTGAGEFTATQYKVYLFASGDPAVEIFLGDVYPNAKQRAALKVALRGDVSQMGFDRITVTAFSKDAQQSFDVLTATLVQ